MSIKLPTVLILGAGASHPYGFPLGVELRDLICEQTTDIRFTAPLRQFGFEPGTTKEFGQALQHSGFGSVDAFLEASPEFAAIGKTAIALTLLPLEQRAKLFPPKAPKNGHWYQYLLGLMGVGTDDWAANRLTILTFNYDRSFEHYFCTVLARRLKVSQLEAAKTFHIIDVLHLHGQLGAYPGLGSKPLGYSDRDLSLDDIALAATSIRTISEPSDLEVFVEAGRRISAARRVFFCGLRIRRREHGPLGKPYPCAECIARCNVQGYYRPGVGADSKASFQGSLVGETLSTVSIRVPAIRSRP